MNPSDIISYYIKQVALDKIVPILSQNKASHIVLEGGAIIDKELAKQESICSQE